MVFSYQTDGLEKVWPGPSQKDAEGQEEGATRESLVRYKADVFTGRLDKHWKRCPKKLWVHSPWE